MVQRISNRVWWSAVAIVCSLILASGRFSQQAKTPVPVSDVVRTRNLQIVDKKGFPRIELDVADDGAVSIAVRRPGMMTSVLHFVDMQVIDFTSEPEKATRSTTRIQQTKKRWTSELKFWHEEGRSASSLSITNAGKNGEWGIWMFGAKDAAGLKGDVIGTVIQPGSVWHETQKFPNRKQ
jgi:hypothetical protein